MVFLYIEIYLHTMKVLFVILLIRVFYSCKKGKTEKLVIQNNSIALQKAGELLYENNCKSCHFSTKSNGHLLKITYLIIIAINYIG